MKKQIEDLTGKQFGRWTVLEYVGKINNSHYWLCKCSCPKGTIRRVASCSLKSGKSKSCGCLHSEIVHNGNTKNLIGQTFGRLTVIERVDNKRKKRGARWLCKCSCGNLHEASGNSLTQGLVKSCGCLFANMRKKPLGMSDVEFSKTRLRQIWNGMKNRCYNKNTRDYKYCGSKGTIVCEEWKNNFNNFYEWSINNGYNDNLTLDRINTFGNYEPSNCRWITISEQQLNRRVNHS